MKAENNLKELITNWKIWRREKILIVNFVKELLSHFLNNLKNYLRFTTTHLHVLKVCLSYKTKELLSYLNSNDSIKFIVRSIMTTR